MKRTINEKEIKITAAGYLYVDGVKVRKNVVTPLSVPSEYGDDVEAVCREYAKKNYRMVQSR